MKRLLFALITFPFVAGAQIDSSPPEFRSRLIMEAAGGVALRPSDATAHWLGGAYAFTVGRTVSPRMSWRAGFEFETWSSATETSSAPYSLLSASFGFLATETAYDRAFYLTGHVGLYMLAGSIGPHPGGYLGVGVAAPIRWGALTFEAGVQGYAFMEGAGPDDASPSTPSTRAPLGNHSTLAVPIRVGYRWLM